MGREPRNAVRLAYRAFEPSLAPDIVVLAYIDEDVERVLEAYRHFEGINKPSFMLRDGHLTARSSMSSLDRAVNLATGHSSLLGLLAWHVYLYRDARPLIQYMVTTIASESKASDRRFIVMRIPTLGDDAARQRLQRRLVDVRGTARDAGAEVLDIDSVFGQERADFYINTGPAAGHLTARGNGLVGRRLADYIESRHCRGEGAR